MFLYPKNSRLATVFATLMIVHLPLPCYDLDGENCGRPTHGIFDVAAWHIVFLGVKPEDDIDRGPISSEPADQRVGGSTFDAAYVGLAKTAVPDSLDYVYLPLDDSHLTANLSDRLLPTLTQRAVLRTLGATFSVRAPQAWRRQLCLIVV